jgi:cephalosporin hydroxylase
LIAIDREAGTLTVGDRTLSLASEEAFTLLADIWLEAGLAARYPYTFTWMGRPVIQFPEDLVRLQELFFRAEPDVVIETGVAHGGSLVFWAGLCRMAGRGRVIGVDIEIRSSNRAAIEAHPLASSIELFEGSSVDSQVVARVHASIRAGERVLLILDSNHTRAHVLGELEAYAPLVAPGSYVVVMDGHVMEVSAGRQGRPASWATENANAAVREFAIVHPEFAIEELRPGFNESPLQRVVCGFTGGLLKRLP